MTNQEQRDVKSKVQSVREVLRSGVSRNDISLVLQHFDYNVELTVAAFLEGQSNEIIHQWSRFNKKTNGGRTKKKDSQKGCIVEVSSSASNSSSRNIALTSVTTADWKPRNDSATTHNDVEIGYPSSSSSLSSDSLSVNSESGVQLSDQATDSGCDTTSTLPVQSSSKYKSESDRSKPKHPPMTLPGLDTTDAAACTAINSCFDLLRTRLGERQVSLMQEVNRLQHDTESTATFSCDLRQLLNSIDTFGKVLPVAFSPCDSSHTDDSVVHDDIKPQHVKPGNSCYEDVADHQETIEETEDVLDESAMESNEAIESLILSRQSSLTGDAITLSNPSHVKFESVKLKTQQNKKSKTKDRRINKKHSGVSASLRNDRDTNVISIEDLINDPSTTKSRAAAKTDRSPTSQDDQPIAYKSNYVFQQSESLTRYEMALNEDKSKTVSKL